MMDSPQLPQPPPSLPSSTLGSSNHNNQPSSSSSSSKTTSFGHQGSSSNGGGDDSETSLTPPIERWSRDFHSLIKDSEGYILFKQYCDDVGLNFMLDFYFACQGLKKKSNAYNNQSDGQPAMDDNIISKLILLIFRRYILKPQILPLSDPCREKLMDTYRTYKNGSYNDNEIKLTVNTFDQAFYEIEQQLSGSIYENFLKSKIFLDVINNSQQQLQNILNQDSNVEQYSKLSKATCHQSILNDQTNVLANGDLPSTDSTKQEEVQSQQFFPNEEQPDILELPQRLGIIMPTIDETSETDGDSTTVIEVTKFAQQPPNQQGQYYSRSSFNRLGMMNNKFGGQIKFLNNNSGNSVSNDDDEHLVFKEYPLDLERAMNFASSNNIATAIPPNPYHVHSAATAHAHYSTVQYNSKKDSEIESISSGDSSFYCRSSDQYSGKKLRNSLGSRGLTNNNSLSISNSTNNNNSGTSGGTLITNNRTIRPVQRPQPKINPNQMLQIVNPDEFARKLIEKLNVVRKEQETNIKLRLAIAQMNLCERESNSQQQVSAGHLQQHSPGHSSGAHGQREAGVGQYSNNSQTSKMTTNTSSTTKSGLGQALKKIDFSSCIETESGQAILDKHFAQVFETPTADSPISNQMSTSYPHPPPIVVHNNNFNLMNSQQLSSHYVTSTNEPNNQALNLITSSSSLPPPSPLSPPSMHNSAMMIGGNHLASSSANSNSIPVYVKFSTEEVPHKLWIDGPQITLYSFKQQIPCKRGVQQFYFKRQCTELERQEIDASYVLEKINDDHALLPQCDGKIYALVELSN